MRTRCAVRWAHLRALVAKSMRQACSNLVTFFSAAPARQTPSFLVRAVTDADSLSHEYDIEMCSFRFGSCPFSTIVHATLVYICIYLVGSYVLLLTPTSFAAFLKFLRKQASKSK